MHVYDINIIQLLSISLGVAVKTPSGEMASKVRLLMCAVDLPARASVLNMKQFNGSGGALIVKGVPRSMSSRTKLALLYHLHPKNTRAL